MDAVILGIGDLFPLGALWGSVIGAVTILTALVGAIGLGSKNLAVGSMGAYLAFAFFATETGDPVLEPILYVSLTVVIIGTAMKFWRLEGLDN
jgi:hypothetical protein